MSQYFFKLTHSSLEASNYLYFLFYFLKGRDDHLFSMKDVWRSLVAPKVCKISGRQYATGQNPCFALNVSPSYVDDKADCKIL